MSLQCPCNVNKDSSRKANAKAKDSSRKANAKAKDSSHKANAKAKDLAMCPWSRPRT